MKDVLFIAMEFAPYQTPGAFRSIYFVKYLRSFNINPIVITIKPEDNHTPFNSKINSELNKHIPADTTIYRSLYKKDNIEKNKLSKHLKMYFKVNDRNAEKWKDGLRNDIDQIITKHQPEAIYISCPPFSAGMLARDISKKYNLPLLVDMRDGWSHWCISPFASYLHYRMVYLREKSVFKQASAVVTVTDELKRIFINTHKEINANNFHTITNGYDKEIEFNEPYSLDGLNDGKANINITYVGNYYYTPEARNDMFTPWYKKRLHKKLQYSPVKEDWLYRSPYFFLKALNELFAQKPELKKKITFTHIGSIPSWLKQMVNNFNLEQNVSYTGFLTHEEMNNEISKTDLFLSTAVKVNGGEDYAIGSKTFDYLLHKKVILGFVTNGAQQNFIRNSNTGIVVNPDNTAECVSALEDIFHNGIELTPNKDYIRSFHRKEAAKKLSEIFTEIIEKSVKHNNIS